jgi:hypothetical protein
MIMKLFSSLPTAILAATSALLSAGAQAGPPLNEFSYCTAKS